MKLGVGLMQNRTASTLRIGIISNARRHTSCGALYGCCTLLDTLIWGDCWLIPAIELWPGRATRIVGSRSGSRYSGLLNRWDRRYEIKASWVHELPLAPSPPTPQTPNIHCFREYFCYGWVIYAIPSWVSAGTICLSSRCYLPRDSDYGHY